MRPPMPYFWRSRQRGAPVPLTRRRLTRRLGAGTVVVTVLGLVLSATVASAAPRSAQSPADGSRPDTATQVAAVQTQMANGNYSTSALPLTLVTGDTVHVALAEDGRPVVQRVEPAPRTTDRPVMFHTMIDRGQVYLVPDDAEGLLQADVLDRELFNLAKLAAHAAAGTTGEVPVIMRHSGPAPAPVEGATRKAHLDSIDATSMTIKGDGRWWEQVSQEPEEGVAAHATGPLAGVEKIWLNELLQVQLEESVPQVSAPVAWDLGYDGTGVTVAVLDTGVDADHPDLAGKIVEQVDFTDSPFGTADLQGHGTHVAATIAGTGAASGGLRPGVAPGAKLRMGKVCDETGSCPADAIIAGMEWAAESGTPIVNMSLGGPATNGTDPLSMALNQLSAEHGTLFVTSAGNAGPDPRTVGAPAVASYALAVAAVDKNNQMADFSARGPALNGLPKPDIAAPGVGIVAARASGTSLGAVVDEHYTALNGTSMAAPHVAGGAAIVLQKNPDLNGRELKARLMGTAQDLGHDVNAQGAGLLNVVQAMDPSILVQGDLSFGRYEYPHDGTLTRNLTLTNVTDEPITVALESTFTLGDDTPAPAGLLSLSTDEVTVPAGGSAGVDVRLHREVVGEEGPFGRYAGVLKAIDGEGVPRATVLVGAFLEPKRHRVTVETVLPEGAADVAYGLGVLSPMNDDDVHDPPQLVNGGPTLTFDLFAGAYAIVQGVLWRGGEGDWHQSALLDPEFEVDGPTTVRLDLRQARPLRVEFPERTELYYSDFTQVRISADGSWALGTQAFAYIAATTPTTWVLPTDPVTHGTFEYRTTNVNAAPPVSMRAVGGGESALDLEPQYVSADYALRSQYDLQMLMVRLEDGSFQARYVPTPVLRLDGPQNLPVVDVGTGTAAEVAAADVDGALALIRAVDICDWRCVMDPIFTGPGEQWPEEALRDRVQSAKDAGAAGVVLAGPSGRTGFTSPRARIAYCMEGLESCPEIRPHLPLPVVTVSADTADRLADRLTGPATVRINVRGDGLVDDLYAAGFSGDHYPSTLPFQLDGGDMHQVENQIHADRPGIVDTFRWKRFDQDLPGDHSLSSVVQLPRVPTQRSVNVFIGPREDGGIIDQLMMASYEYELPFVPELPDADGLDERNMGVYVTPMEFRAAVLGDEQEFTWNVGPMVPTAADLTVTESGFAVSAGLPSMVYPQQTATVCAGCRSGDRLFPTVYLGSSAGHRLPYLAGLVEDDGFGPPVLGTNKCGPPRCELRLFDAGGDEITPTLLPVEAIIVLGEDGGPRPNLTIGGEAAQAPIWPTVPVLPSVGEEEMYR